MRHADGHRAGGLALTKGSVLQVAQAIGKTKRPSVIWLHFQDCTDAPRRCCARRLLSRAPDPRRNLARLSRDLDGRLGRAGEAALRSAIADNAGKYVLVVEGSIPTRDDGVYMELGGKPAIQVVRDVAAQAAAVIAIGSCASWGGVPSRTRIQPAHGREFVISGKPIVNLPVALPTLTTCWQRFWNT